MLRYSSAKALTPQPPLPERERGGISLQEGIYSPLPLRERGWG